MCGLLPVAGPDLRILYCRPSGRVTTPGCLALLARKALAAAACAGGAGPAACGFAWQAASVRAASAIVRIRNIGLLSSDRAGRVARLAEGVHDLLRMLGVARLD